MKVIKVVRKADVDLFKGQTFKEFAREQKLVERLQNVAPHQSGISLSVNGMYVDYSDDRFQANLILSLYDDGRLTWLFNVYRQSSPYKAIVDLKRDGKAKIKTGAELYPFLKSLLIELGEYFETAPKKRLERLKSSVSKAFKSACFAAGIKTPNGANSYYKAFTNLSKRAPGPKGGSRYNLKEWPTIYIDLLEDDKVKASAQLENISNLTGYQPDKGVGYNVKFPELKGVKVTAENVESVVKNYVDKILSQWKALPGSSN